MPNIITAIITMMRQIAICFAAILLFVSFPTAAYSTMVRDTELEFNLQQLMAPLLEAANYPPNSIVVRIIIDPDYNAFVAGEQIIYLHSGLILNAESAEEIVGVMAHEIGHIKAGHLQRRDASIAEANSASALAALAAFAVAAGGGGDAAVGVLIGGQDQVARRLLRTSRHDEAVADEIGLSLLEKSGISANGLRNMMQRMAAQRALPESRQSRYYQTHPDAAERLSVYLDHFSRQTGRTIPIRREILALVDRVETKLRAYVEPPQSILQQFDDAGSLDHLYAKSIALYRRGELEAAIAVINKLIKITPQDAFFHEFRGDILMSMAKPGIAAQAYEQAISIRPDSPQILLNYGRALIASGGPTDLTIAISALEQARDGEPKWAFVYRQLAIAYGRAGQLADADITLADEALMTGDAQLAINMAKRALSHGNVRDEIKNRANDILYRYDALEK